MTTPNHIDDSTLLKSTPTWLDKIKTAYSQPTRHYHTLTHINDLLQLLSEHRDELDNPRCVELAILFHDIVYDPTTTEVGFNERKSNDVFLEYASDPAVSETLTGLDKRDISPVSSMILATIHHQPTSSLLHDTGALEDLKFFLDIDMSILAAEETQYDAYAAAIRNEYAHYSELAYCFGRRKVLRDFLQRERIYFSDAFEGSGMEERARSNICREIERLQASDGSS
ncbi:uncharacterized protein LACBIDRAFT_296076 [Laccaria bicolor S238N-H82]|uniref:Predicted protein n=1 Tax=Laccaria bicolor (strain S238N-H82 / ATCC MYA-4686) TaxID=486041 RepID=B0DLN2_LACBS|nr:uncharacterized protein LACBIDRAFT_304457 [Laccaria bicolor S238N-H82]XP_001891268.1 uncharacterized protein LACBIDRAFT_296076 [Laccaria bicolor S238N-H82]EDQ98081.1 predicted protein [Laccaria bicolor S238N-H82]EDR04419.1 predicted protein [Laccaria bicolor S238N-H82]|eukprot:XP_001884938.1 predicted protein [Laccaria bicolor S238N-H82]